MAGTRNPLRPAIPLEDLKLSTTYVDRTLRARVSLAMETAQYSEPILPVESFRLFGSDLGAPPLATSFGKILIVAGDASKKRILREPLAGFEQEVIEVSTTSEAISAISLQRVDLILIDLSTPEVGAVEFCKTLRRADATRFISIFVIAQSDDVEAEVGAINAGADEFLIAPLRIAGLRARLQASLRHKALLDSLDDSETVLFSLAKSVEAKDPDLGQHCQRLALMGAALGLALNLPAQDIFTLQRGGYLHDIGKIAIPDRVLYKAGPLTADEWETMKSHTVQGERICSRMKSLTPVLPIIRNHHERWDGSGYPDGLKAEQIPLLARVLQIADIYDALTTARPYKRSFSSDEAIAILREETAKGWRDPRLVSVFADILPMFRTPILPDFSRLSLHALASSIERYRSQPGRASSLSKQTQLVG